MILIFSDSDSFSDPVVVPLETKIAGDRLRVDASGNFYLLGLAEDEYRETIQNQHPGDCPLLHKFSPNGDHIYSTLIRPVDASKGKFSFSYTSPLLATSNIAVSADGEVWMLWAHFTGEEIGFPVTSLYNISPGGELRIIDQEPPESGYTLIGIVKNVDTFEVLFEWKRNNPDVEMNTILVGSDGNIVFKENIKGKILTVDNDTIVTTAYKDNKHHLIEYSY